MILRLNGSRSFALGCEAAWRALHDVAVLRPCVPGCLSLERSCETRYDLSVLVPIGPVSMAFSGSVAILEARPPHRLVLRGRGAGGLAGLAEGTAYLDLTATPSGCRLDYAIAAEPSGPFAIVGTFVLSGLARSLVDTFGTRLTERLVPPAVVPALKPSASALPAGR